MHKRSSENVKEMLVRGLDPKTKLMRAPKVSNSSNRINRQNQWEKIEQALRLRGTVKIFLHLHFFSFLFFFTKGKKEDTAFSSYFPYIILKKVFHYQIQVHDSHELEYYIYA